MDRLDPFNSVSPLTPSDTVDLVGIGGIWVGGAGNVAVLMGGQTATVVLMAVPAGTFLPIVPKRVYATGTTATNMVVMRQA